MTWMLGNAPKSAMGLAASCAAAILAGCPATAQACPTIPKNCVPGNGDACQTITIWNDSAQYLFPVLDTGKNPNPAGDVWMQAICKVPKNGVATSTYAEDLGFRIYISEDTGIAPGGSVTITVPLFTQLVATPTATPGMPPNQYVDWWRGENIWIFTNASAAPPKALQEYHDNPIRKGTMEHLLPNQQPLTSKAASPTFPSSTCTLGTGKTTCSSKVEFFSDSASLPLNGPAQLFEATLGARQELKVVNPATDPPNSLDITNADFDVSYVDVAYMTGAMGPKDNDQVGYVGSRLTPGQFQDVLVDKFLPVFDGWPQFVITYADGTKQTMSKLASPSNALARLTGASPPADLTAPPEGSTWPIKVWSPIQALRDNWTTWAGPPSTPGQCATTPGAFCKALLDVKALFNANYKKYVSLFPPTGTTCSGTPIPTSDKSFADRFLAHVYGWTPWTEAVKDTGTGCGPADNLLQDTPGYFTFFPPPNNKTKDYTIYAGVKLEYDNLEYNKDVGTTPAGVVFNPWVAFLHNADYLNIPGVYAYSVDDAVGNIQAEATGFIIDVGGLTHLENQSPAAPPITVGLGYDPNRALNYVAYQLCSTSARKKTVNPLSPAFIISANAPQKCPVFLIDNGVGKSAPNCKANAPCPQTYTFTVTQPPPVTDPPPPLCDGTNNEPPKCTDWATLTLAQKGASPSLARWSGAPPNNTTQFDTTKVIDCSGNTGISPDGSSKAWCCNLTSKSGVFAYSFPEPASAHKALVHVIDAGNPLPSNTSTDMTCSMGK